MTIRNATKEELVAHLRPYGDRPVRFRHFVRELIDRRGRVSHRQYNRSSVTIVDGTPTVTHHGETYALRATWRDELHGIKLSRPIIHDVRLDSDYL